MGCNLLDRPPIEHPVHQVLGTRQDAFVEGTEIRPVHLPWIYRVFDMELPHLQDALYELGLVHVLFVEPCDPPGYICLNENQGWQIVCSLPEVDGRLPLVGLFYSLHQEGFEPVVPPFSETLAEIDWFAHPKTSYMHDELTRALFENYGHPIKQNFILQATAGAGKTTLIGKICAANNKNGYRMLYMTFTKDMAKEAEKRFKLEDMTDISTIDGWALRTMYRFWNDETAIAARGYAMEGTPNSPSESAGILKKLKEDQPGCTLAEAPKKVHAKHAVRLLDRLFQTTPIPSHTINTWSDLRAAALTAARRIAWCNDRQSKHNHRLFIETALERLLLGQIYHCDAVKWFLYLAASSGKRNLLDRYQMVIVDEMQDMTHVEAHLFKYLEEEVPTLFVGDPCQRIYNFRVDNSFTEIRGQPVCGCFELASRENLHSLNRERSMENWLAQMANARCITQLSRTYRLSNHLAKQTASWLHEVMNLSPAFMISDIETEESTGVFVDDGVPNFYGDRSIYMFRYNNTMFGMAMRAIEDGWDEQVVFANRNRLRTLIDTIDQKRSRASEQQLLNLFGDTTEDQVEITGFKLVVKALMEMSRERWDFFSSRLRLMVEREGTVYFGTTHAFKGAEAPVVRLHKELTRRVMRCRTLKPDELAIVYVAMTRAKLVTVLDSLRE